MKISHTWVWCVVVLLLFVVFITQAQVCVPNSKWKSKADEAVSTFIKRFSTSGSWPLNYYYPSNNQRAPYWVYAVAFDSIVSASNAINPSAYNPWISTLYQGVGNSWVDSYFDDMNWMTMALLNAHSHTSDAKYLTTAVSLFSNIMAAWDTSCCPPHPGGNWWDARHTQKATASNAGPVISSLILFRKTQNPVYRDYAYKLYSFWREYEVNNSTGQVVDHLDVPSGQQVWWSFTYNQGLMIGAAMEMYYTTNNKQFLNDANLVARFLAKSQTTGNVMHDCGNPPGGDCPNFKGIGYKYLAQLEKLEGKGEYRAVLSSSVNSLWNNARGGNGGDLFNWNWLGPAPSGTVSVSQENAAMLALIWACTLE